MAKYKIIPSSRAIVQSPISIGHEAEKGVEAIEFDVTAWVETYGSGTLTVIMRRWGDAIPYPIALEIDENNKATWTLSDIDTAKAGMAYAQLSYIVGETVVKKSDIYTFRVMDSLTGEGEPPEAYESWLEHLTRLAAEAMAEVLDIESIVTDKTLTIDGGIADAAETGRQIGLIKADLEDLDERVEALEEGGSGESGLTADIKQALLQLASKVAYIDEDGQDYYDDLHDALYPPVHVTGITLSDNSVTINALNSTHTLTATITPANYTDAVSWTSSDITVATVANGVVTAVGYGTATITVSANGISATCSVTVAQVTLSSINAVYTQSGTVYSNATLDSLKSDLVVTATWSDTSTSTVNAADYTLSGTLTAGTSTITVSYGGQTDTFTVTVTSEWDVDWSYTDGLPTVKGFTLIESNNATASLGNDGLELTITNKDNKIGWDYPTNGTKRVFECEFVLKQNNNVVVCLSEDGTNGVAIRAQYSSNYKGIYLMDAGAIGSMTKLKTITNVNERHKIKLVVDNGVGAVYIDDVLVTDNVDTSTQYYTTHTHFTCTNAASGTANGLFISMKLKLGRTS